MSDTQQLLPSVTTIQVAANAHQTESPPQIPSLHQWSSDYAQTQHARIALLLFEKGTEAVARHAKQLLPLGCTINAFISLLKNDVNYINELRRKKILYKSQCDVLWPSDGSVVDEKKIDLTLWCVLTRILYEKSSSHRNPIEWGAEPAEGDNQPEHYVIRLRMMRNRISHQTQFFSGREFEQVWSIVSTALCQLGCDEASIQQYKTRDMDPLTTDYVLNKLRIQTLDETVRTLEQKNKNRKWLICGIVGLCFVLICAILATAFSVGIKIQHPVCGGKPMTIVTPQYILNYMTRSAWGASPPAGPTASFSSPVEYVIITNTGTLQEPSTMEEYCQILQSIQQFDIRHFNFSDIQYNYMIGENGVIYEGRGTYYVPTTAWGYNYRSISVSFIGTFQDRSPSGPAQMSAQVFFSHLVSTGTLHHNATVYGICQIRTPYRDNPGKPIMNTMKEWKDEGDWAWRPLHLEQCDI